LLDRAGFDGETDLFDQAVALVVFEARRPPRPSSASSRSLQPRSQADQANAEGLVGPANHVGKRKVLVRWERKEK